VALDPFLVRDTVDETVAVDESVVALWVVEVGNCRAFARLEHFEVQVSVIADVGQTSLWRRICPSCRSLGRGSPCTMIRTYHIWPPADGNLKTDDRNRLGHHVSGLPFCGRAPHRDHQSGPGPLVSKSYRWHCGLVELDHSYLHDL